MSQTHFDWKGRRMTKFTAFSAFAVGAILALTSQPALAQLNVYVSGYEVFLGVTCTINNEPATCGVQFSGWTGGSGQVAGGWTSFPGNGEGYWTANVNYSGKAGFGNTATLLGGSWELLFRNGTVFKGTVSAGAVTWPAQNSDIGCGTNVATITATLAVKGDGTATFAGCLHDLPVFTVIPPKIWGSFLGLP
jgi:hypothetical protein